MATFTELLSEVTTLTNRPDLLAETKLAVKAATLKLHQSDFFYKDLHEDGISFSAAEYAQQIEFRTLFPRVRALKYLRKADSSGTAGSFIKVLTPSEVLDADGIERTDICYAAGELIQVKSSTTFQYALMGYYLNPDITEAGFNSWLALDHMYAIVFEAAVTVFKTIGYDEQAAIYTKLAGEQLALVRSSNIQVEGY